MPLPIYNLVRALMGVASQQSDIPPRGCSFTKVRRILEVFGPALANAPDQQSAQRSLDQIMTYVQQSQAATVQTQASCLSQSGLEKGRLLPKP